MGSKADLKTATKFITQHRIAPFVSRVFDGLENAEGFELLAGGKQFGKIVIRMDGSINCDRALPSDTASHVLQTVTPSLLRLSPALKAGEILSFLIMKNTLARSSLGWTHAQQVPDLDRKRNVSLWFQNTRHRRLPPTVWYVFTLRK